MKNCLPLLLLGLVSSFAPGNIASRVDDVKCDVQLKHFSESLSRRESWSIELFDSWTKFQAGVTYGNVHDFGNFDQCVEFEHNSSVGLIQGQHCVIYYRAAANASSEHPLADGIFDWREIGSFARERQLRLGGAACLPSTCSTPRIQSFVNDFLQSADLHITSDYDQSQWCATNEPKDFETIDIVCVVILSLLALLLLSSTTYELAMIRRNREPHELFAAFSVYKNGAKLFDMSRKKSNTLHCLSGLRTLAMLHILMGHRYNWTRGFGAMNSSVYASDGKWSKTIFSAFVEVNPIAVDTFFVIGGLLVARSILHQMEKGKFNIPKMYLHRYLRTMPVLAFLVLIILSLLKHLGNGPSYQFVTYSAMISQCEQFWWSALLNIQNFFNPIEVCLQASWYISADFQLILISPLLMYPIYKWGWKFLWLLPTYVVATEIWVFVISLQNRYKASRFFMPFDVSIESAKRLYFPTHIRCGPWLIGIMLGYIFHQTRHRKVVINKVWNATLWILSLGVIIAILVGRQPLQNAEKPASQVANALWLAFTRNNWGYSIAWIIFACQHGSGGIIKWFLELPCWQPLARMSLSFYLVHTVYITIAVGSGRVPTHFSDRSLLHNYAGDFVASVFLASVLYLTLEEPILLIENYAYKRLAARTKKERN